ncbi:putative metal-binding motif-containing protein [Candidatus Woesearchaeota archaeon]|nr:putative metal-binding motif-containing protein [Candidatus Woesearchaeota archaeon]
MTDRSYDYPTVGSSLGKGIQAYDADNLSLLWYVDDVLCSSHMGALLDLTGDNVLDVTVVQELGRGIYTVNGLTGEKIPGKWSNSIPVSGHSPFPLGDIDLDGHVELISNDYGVAKVWDLDSWSLDATLDYFAEPPKMLDVIGDSRLEIVGGYGPVRVYNSSYNQIENLTSAGSIGTMIVQDIDSDGQNELVVIGSGGTVQLFETSAYSPEILPRTNVQFYSERRLGAGVYVPPPGAPQAFIYDASPSDSGVNVSLNPPLAVRAVDYRHDPIDVEFSSNASGVWRVIAYYENVSNGVFYANPVDMNESNTTYFWHVVVRERGDGLYTEKSFSFTTAADAEHACSDLDEDGFSPDGDLCGPVDCNDLDYLINPNATETCDGVDNDCSDLTLDGSGEVAPFNFLQLGVCVNSTQSCIAGNWTDDYSNVSSYESNETLCDGLDNDCNGLVDEGLLLSLFLDFDNDSFGNSSELLLTCSLTAGYVAQDGDCDDDAFLVNPGMNETCFNMVDDDCDGFIDEDCACFQDSDCDPFDNDYCVGSSVYHDDYVCLAGACVWNESAVVLDCDDGLACNGLESCDLGSCIAGEDVDCSAFDIFEIADCRNIPEDTNPFTWDYRAAFTSVCEEPSGECTVGDDTIYHVCSIENCSATCEADIDCDDNLTSTSDACVGCVCLHEPLWFCGDGVCDLDENCSSCSADCGECPALPFCGDGVCNGDENCSSCETDCGVCSDVNCTFDADCDNGLACDGLETCSLGACAPGTPVDCSAYDIIDVESCTYSPDDNPFTLDYRAAFTSVCEEPSGECTVGDENITHTCDVGICGAACVSDLDCDDGNESTADSCLGCSCSFEPLSSCGDGVCGADENCSSCEADCGVCPDVNCTFDADCDNGLACDGLETCVLGDCAPGTPVDCSAYDVFGINTCDNSPDDNPFTFDYLAPFTSECQEPTGTCSESNDTMTHSCDLNCSAECVIDADCDDSNTSTLDTCLSGCTCEHTVLEFCGDGIVNGNESCEPNMTQSCVDFGGHDGVRTCTSECGWGTCVALPYCGDGVCDAGEDCGSCESDCDCNITGCDLPNKSWNEDTSLVGAYDLSSCFDDPLNSTLNYSVVRNQSVLVIGIGEDGLVNVSAPANWYGFETLYFTASSGNRSAQTNMVTLSVIPVTDCGDLVCEAGETCSSCAVDCGACTVSSSGGGGGGGGGSFLSSYSAASTSEDNCSAATDCSTQLVCTDWSICINSEEYRTCLYENESRKETRPCNASVEDNSTYVDLVSSLTQDKDSSLENSIDPRDLAEASGLESVTGQAIGAQETGSVSYLWFVAALGLVVALVIGYFAVKKWR